MIPKQDTRKLVVQWIHEHRDAMLLAAKRWAGPAVSAEDIVQEASIAAMRAHRKAVTAKKPRAWLIGFVKNVGRRVIWKKMRRKRQYQPWRDELLMRAEAEKRRAVTGHLNHRREFIWELALHLPTMQREVVWCMLLLMDDKEIAEELGIPRGTVRQLRMRARKKLARLIHQGP